MAIRVAKGGERLGGKGGGGWNSKGEGKVKSDWEREKGCAGGGRVALV